MNKTYIRRAHHSGSWYDNDPRLLDKTLSKYLADASENKVESYETESITDSENNGVSDSSVIGIPRACISPHAGFRYSGSIAAYSFIALKEALLTNPWMRTVVILHPSHHVYLDGCAISGEWDGVSTKYFTCLSVVYPFLIAMISFHYQPTQRCT